MGPETLQRPDADGMLNCLAVRPRAARKTSTRLGRHPEPARNAGMPRPKVTVLLVSGAGRLRPREPNPKAESVFEHSEPGKRQRLPRSCAGGPSPRAALLGKLCRCRQLHGHAPLGVTAHDPGPDGRRSGAPREDPPGLWRNARRPGGPPPTHRQNRCCPVREDKQLQLPSTEWPQPVLVNSAALPVRNQLLPLPFKGGPRRFSRWRAPDLANFQIASSDNSTGTRPAKPAPLAAGSPRVPPKRRPSVAEGLRSTARLGSARVRESVPRTPRRPASEGAGALPILRTGSVRPKQASPGRPPGETTALQPAAVSGSAEPIAGRERWE